MVPGIKIRLSYWISVLFTVLAFVARLTFLALAVLAFLALFALFTFAFVLGFLCENLGCREADSNHGDRQKSNQNTTNHENAPFGAWHQLSTHVFYQRSEKLLEKSDQF